MASQRFDVPAEIYRLNNGIESTAPVPIAVDASLKKDASPNLVVVSNLILRANVLIYLDFRYFTGPRAGTPQDAAELSDKFDRDGYVVFGQDSTSLRLEVPVGGLDPSDPYTFTVEAKSAEANTFLSGINSNEPIYFELWDERPTTCGRPRRCEEGCPAPVTLPAAARCRHRPFRPARPTTFASAPCSSRRSARQTPVALINH